MPKGTELNINISELRTQIKRLDKAISKFETYSEKFIEESRDKLSDSKSDFVIEIRAAMDNMRDTIAPDLVEKLKEYSETISEMVSSFELTDEAYSTRN